MPDSIFEWIFLAGFVIGTTIRKVYGRHFWKTKTAFSRQNALDTAFIALASVALAVLPLVYVFSSWLDFADYSAPAWAGWAGAPVFAAALWLLWRSHVDLGRNFAPTVRIREEHALSTGGVYKHIRHPMYAAHWLWAVAQALLLHNWIAGPAMLVVFLPFYFVRVKNEERMLLDHFGEAYREYMARTGGVIPRFKT